MDLNRRTTAQVERRSVADSSFAVLALPGGARSYEVRDLRLASASSKDERRAKEGRAANPIRGVHVHEAPQNLPMGAGCCRRRA